MKLRLTDLDRERFERAATYSACAEPPRAGWFRLYNKNGARTTFVRPVGQVPDRMIWIVDAPDPLDPYFVHILTPDPQ